MCVLRVVQMRAGGVNSQMTKPPKTISAQAWFELLILAFIWGGSFLSMRVALNEIGPLTAVAHRTGWAMLILWVYIIFRRLLIPREVRIWVAFLLMGILNNVIPFSLMAWGQLHIETGLTSILNAATAIFGVIAAAIFFADERLSLHKGIGVLLGFWVWQRQLDCHHSLILTCVVLVNSVSLARQYPMLLQAF